MPKAEAVARASAISAAAAVVAALALKSEEWVPRVRALEIRISATQAKRSILDVLVAVAAPVPMIREEAVLEGMGVSDG